jgi:hypothetical protein
MDAPPGVRNRTDRPRAQPNLSRFTGRPVKRDSTGRSPPLLDDAVTALAEAGHQSLGVLLPAGLELDLDLDLVEAQVR